MTESDINIHADTCVVIVRYVFDVDSCLNSVKPDNGPIAESISTPIKAQVKITK